MTGFPPTSSPSTTSGRLGHPWFHKDWARTPWTSPKGQTQNTWKPPDQSSLHDFCRTGINLIEAMQTFIFFRRQCWRIANREQRIATRPSDQSAHVRTTVRRPRGGQHRRCGQPVSANNLQHEPETNGGAERDRTADLRSAIAALSQLSYGPFYSKRIASSQ